MHNEQYNNIEIPKELNMIVKNTIQKNKRKRRTILSLAASLLVLFTFTLSLNSSPVFAELVSEVPIINKLANILTFKSYTVEEADLTKNVNQVVLHMDGIDEYVNEIIEDKVTTVLKEATIRVEEYKDAFISTGGSEEEFKEKNMEVTIDYDIFYQSEDFISFRVYSHETLAAVYAENMYFTINLQSKEITQLSDFLGQDYQSTLTELVISKISQAPENYFEVKSDFQVREDIDFYLVDDETIAVVFNKYEIAPGSMGRVTFQVPLQ